MVFIQINNVTYLDQLQELYLVDGQDLLTELEDQLESGELTISEIELILIDYTKASK